MVDYDGCIEGHRPGELDAISQCLLRGRYVRLESEAWHGVDVDLGDELRSRLPADQLFTIKRVGKWIWVHNQGTVAEREQVDGRAVAILDSLIDY